jgi:hypothetical protein
VDRARGSPLTACRPCGVDDLDNDLDDDIDDDDDRVVNRR